jgi:exopolysaccharide production protein ExoZ
LYDKGLHRLYYAGFSAFFLIAAALYLHRAEIKKITMLSLIGDASYSIYLSHFFSIGLTSFVRSYYGIGEVTDMVLVSLFIIINLVFSTIVGVLVYRLIEEPVNLRLRKKRH